MQNVSLVSLSASCAFKVKYSSILLVKKTGKKKIIIVPNFSVLFLCHPFPTERISWIFYSWILPLRKDWNQTFYFPPKMDMEKLLLNVHFELRLDWFFFFFLLAIVWFPSVWHQNKATPSTHCHTAEGCLESEAVKSLLLFSVKKPWIAVIC